MVFDFLNNPATRECQFAAGDVTQTDDAFRLFMFVFAAVVLSIPVVYHYKVYAPTAPEGQLQAGDGEDSLAAATATPTKRMRLWHLDYFRIIAVWAVIMEHSGGEEYTRTNVAWTLMWVQQYLMFISGMGFMMSRSPLWQYQIRLGIVTLVGCLANLLGFVLAGGNRVGHREICYTGGPPYLEGGPPHGTGNTMCSCQVDTRYPWTHIELQAIGDKPLGTFIGVQP